MVAHGLITGMLFFLAGSVKHRYHTLEISRLSGMLIQVPRLAWILGMCAMASLGLPGLAGFWGEFPAILAAYSPNFGLEVSLYRTLMVIAAVGTVLAAAYLLWLYQRTAFGVPPAEFASGHADDHGHRAPGQIAHSLSAAANARAEGSDEAHASRGGSGAYDEHAVDTDIHDVTLVEWITWTPFLLGIVVFGVVPALMFDVFDPAVTQLVERVGAGLP
jgi:NADH-quinone oxidoreductase subunit M